MNNNIQTIYTTISDGQTHIAADTNYIGSVNSYNNRFTQLFAWIFRLSISVNFDGKFRSVNKTSYQNLLRHLTHLNKIEDLSQFTTFKNVAKKVKLANHELKMRHAISKADSHALFVKLAEAISKGDTAKALLMIGKGAELDEKYFHRSQMGPAFTSDNEHLYSAVECSFKVFHAAPIMQAVKKANKVVSDFLIEAGASTESTGKAYTFTRNVSQGLPYQEIVYEPHYRIGYQPHHRIGYHCGRHPGRRGGVYYAPTIATRIPIIINDSRSEAVKFSLKSDKDGLSITS